MKFKVNAHLKILLGRISNLGFALKYSEKKKISVWGYIKHWQNVVNC